MQVGGYASSNLPSDTSLLSFSRSTRKYVRILSALPGARSVRLPRGNKKLAILALAFTCLSFISLKLSSSYYPADARIVHEIHHRDVGRQQHIINVLTYSDRVTPGLCRSMATAALQGFELRVLGVDEASFMGFSGDPKMKKLLGMQALFQK